MFFCHTSDALIDITTHYLFKCLCVNICKDVIIRNICNRKFISYKDRAGIDFSVWRWGFPLFHMLCVGDFHSSTTCVEDFCFTSHWTERGRFQCFNCHLKLNFRCRRDKNIIQKRRSNNEVKYKSIKCKQCKRVGAGARILTALYSDS